jgi:predicted transcriptional regulator of viral defense system
MTLLGIGKLDRERVTALIRGTQHTIDLNEAATILHVSRTSASKILSHLTNTGWMMRVKQGVYLPVPLESKTVDIALEDPWIIAEKLYSPCYIAGWSAAEYWGLTEQIFRTLVAFTTKTPRNRSPLLKGTSFLLHTVSSQALFGLKSIWRGQIKVSVSDPSRTVLDCLVNPKFGGGLRHSIDILGEYLKSEHKNLPLLMDYAKRLDNKAVFKRLGFLLEQHAPNEQETIQQCQAALTVSKTKLDPAQDDDNKLVTRWRLWVPRNLKGSL